jgi:hypothetical protein
MLIKKRDSKKAEIEELTTLLNEPLPKHTKNLIKQELQRIKTGEQGEKDAAYFIDFEFEHYKNWAVIHDLRLEHRGRVAQIDHLLINRLLNVYVLESKNYSYGMKITDTGEFLVRGKDKYFPIESPIEQNNRHIIVLKAIFKQYDIMPKRLGITIIPTFKSYIFMSTESLVIRPPKKKFDTSMVIKADTLGTQVDKDFDNMSTLSALAAVGKIISSETLKGVAQRLAALHKPMKRDYRKQFGLENIIHSKDNAAPLDKQPSEQSYCFKCKKKISEKVAKFCWNNKQRFGGKAYCIDCQKAFPGRS